MVFIMESRALQITSRKNNKLSIQVIPGHFATNHSHINYYIDMTAMKHQHKMASAAAREMAEYYANNTPIETIVCMDGTEVIAANLAYELTKSGVQSINEGADINIITPEFNNNGQMIFRDNVQKMLWNKHVLLLMASVTTGKTINRSLECIKYYGGIMTGITAIFSAIDSMDGLDVNYLFSPDEVPGYHSYAFKECPDCAAHKKIDAIVNSYGYSKI